MAAAAMIWRERRIVPALCAAVTKMTKQSRAQGRAARLHREALNCLRIAVTEDEQDHSADLIDEALKLAKRSRELNGVE